MDDEKGNNAKSGDAQIILNMEGMIKNYISSIEKLEVEIKQKKEMLDDIFINDPTYKKHVEDAKQANKIKQATKQQILKRPQANELDSKIKSLKSQLNENQTSLSDYLQEYQRMSGVSEIEGEDGEIREIVYVAKLRRKVRYPQ